MGVRRTITGPGSLAKSFAKMRSSLARSQRFQIEPFTGFQRRINRGIDVPGLPRGRRREGSSWAICLVKNEEDVIEFTVRHMLAQGVAGVIVVDNGSSDRTGVILDRLARQDRRVHVGVDREERFFQGRKMSYLAHLAWRAGADWVIPFDADEQWFAPGLKLAPYLATLTVDSVSCEYRHVYPLPGEELLVPGGGSSVQVECEPTGWSKVAFRARRWVWIDEGNHRLLDDAEAPGRGLQMLHYSARSLGQYARKTEEGVAALERAGMSQVIGYHWRQWAVLTPQEREQAWRSYLDGHAGLLQPEPGNRVVVDDPGTWRTWDPEHRLTRVDSTPGPPPP
ncbi:hypothetical protein ATC03_14625 [Agromyces aureus]|uniref:Glycosyltransferase 2-like domain-containing protein n=1 Tax=Agromyces aureus TaxID=453304 RepID=A0A191WHW1_9MICO|nr:hypothetical protein ATC03_14625 [Agromyces aureus]